MVKEDKECKVRKEGSEDWRKWFSEINEENWR